MTDESTVNAVSGSTTVLIEVFDTGLSYGWFEVSRGSRMSDRFG